MSFAVEMRGVAKTFDGAHAVHALQGFDFTLRDGEFAAVLGPSGCGKSTLLNVIAGFEKVSTGEVRVYDTPVTRPGVERAVVFQEAALFPWLTVWENVVFSPKINHRPRSGYEPRAREYLRLMGLEAFTNARPDQLSGGMKQRVGLARALLMEPRILLMDEPFGALDAQTRLDMQELLLKAWEQEKRTVLFITHDIDEAILLADNVYVMTARPGTIRSAIPIELERPRSIEMLVSERFNALRGLIMSQIREESRKSSRN